MIRYLDNPAVCFVNQIGVHVGVVRRRTPNSYVLYLVIYLEDYHLK